LADRGWASFPTATNPPTSASNPSVAIKSADLDSLGDDFEKTAKGFVDFLLLDAKGFPFVGNSLPPSSWRAGRTRR